MFIKEKRTKKSNNLSVIYFIQVLSRLGWPYQIYLYGYYNSIQCIYPSTSQFSMISTSWLQLGVFFGLYKKIGEGKSNDYNVIYSIWVLSRLGRAYQIYLYGYHSNVQYIFIHRYLNLVWQERPGCHTKYIYTDIITIFNVYLSIDILVQCDMYVLVVTQFVVCLFVFGEVMGGFFWVQIYFGSVGVFFWFGYILGPQLQVVILIDQDIFYNF
eukprot:TRINITY_DN1666_c1_g1_i5.p5 TRINITY_DN1666_c1_g1~~TRINITY_DN1666_c1_g1_i5.p5  ORF type:complete len:213 (-),score=-4.88 TRINITY_DN1666_c1_g1_i5:1137-1775(-)